MERALAQRAPATHRYKQHATRETVPALKKCYLRRTLETPACCHCVGFVAWRLRCRSRRAARRRLLWSSRRGARARDRRASVVLPARLWLLRATESIGAPNTVKRDAEESLA